MNISETNYPIKVCDLLLNEETNVRALWDIKWNESVDDQILSQNNGRCYYITVNNKIFKIGYSDCDGGIKKTINSYRNSGNSGRPSDRTHGIHVFIAEQLLLENKVEIYFHYNPLIITTLELLDGSKVSVENSISGKILESKNLEIYKDKYSSYPIWNLKENGKPWPKTIQESRNKLLSGARLKLNEIKERLF